MSAEWLREAADRLDALAQAATSGPWEAFRAHAVATSFDRSDFIGVTRDIAVDYDPDVFSTQKCRAEDAAYIAAMHPGVGKALAAWLRDDADAWRVGTDYFNPASVAVADAILGGTA